MSTLTLSPPFTTKRLLQGAVGLAALVPIGAGLAGVIEGAAFTGGTVDISADSHFRYLSGLLLAIGLLFWSCIPRIEHRTALFRALTLMVLVGGLARLYGAYRMGLPGLGMRFGLVMELIVTPAACLWQARVARAAAMDGACGAR